MHSWQWRFVIVDDRDPRALRLSPVLAETIGEAVAAEQVPPTILLRWQEPYVLLGPADTRLPNLQSGIDWLARAGLPAFMRISGGSAVYLDERCLSFAVIIPSRDLSRLRQNYDVLAGGVIEGLRAFGVSPRFGEAPDAYCPGPYDLLVGPTKIAGIAQAMRRGFAEVGGMVLVSQPAEEAVQLLEGFYATAGAPRRFAVGQITNLQRLTGRSIDRREVGQAIRQAYAARWRLTDGTLSPQEIARARQLLKARRFTSSPNVGLRVDSETVE